MSSDLEKDKNFKAPKDANPLSKHFDEHNGDFDTPEEFIRAYINNDRRALAVLELQDMTQLREAMENMSPALRKMMNGVTEASPEAIRKYLKFLADEKGGSQKS